MDTKKKLDNILFVINPISGDIEKLGLKETIEAFCQKHAIAFSMYETTGEDDLDKLKDYVQLNPFEAVFAVGGDGTVNLVASVLNGTNRPLGIIPVGSGNGLSKDLGIPQDSEEALELLLHHDIRRIDTVKVNGQYSFHISDLGFNALIVKRFCEGQTRGPAAYAWAALQEYMHYEPKRYKIVTDEQTFEGEAFMVTIANANAFGSNANINPFGILNDGKFEICLIEPFPKTAGLGILYRLYNDTIDSSVYTRTISCKSATIYNLENEVAHIDGEPVDLGTEIHAEINPQSLAVIIPGAAPENLL